MDEANKSMDNGSILANRSFQVTPLHAPRLADLNGKTICELSNDNWEWQRTFPVIRELLQRQFPTAKIIPYTELRPDKRGDRRS